MITKSRRHRLFSFITLSFTVLAAALAHAGTASTCEDAFSRLAVAEKKAQQLANTHLSREDFFTQLAALIGEYPELAKVFDDYYTGDFRISDEDREAKRKEYLKDQILVDSLQVEAEPEPLSDLREALKPLLETENHVLFQITDERRTRVLSVLSAFFLNQRQKMTTLAYRERGLIPDTVASALWLMMTHLQTLDRSEWATHYVAFDKKIWRSFSYRLRKLVESFSFSESQVLSAEQENELYKIHDLKSPFYPSLGLSAFVVPKESEPDGKVYVISRLYREDKPDPYHLIDGLQVLSPNDSIKMYAAVIGNLPAGATVEVEAHSPGHARYYESLGFQPIHSEEIELLGKKLVSITLRGQRESVVETMKRRTGSN